MHVHTHKKMKKKKSFSQLFHTLCLIFIANSLHCHCYITGDIEEQLEADYVKERARVFLLGI